MGGLRAVNRQVRVPHRAHRIHQKRQRGYVIKVGMCQKHVIDPEQLFYAKITDAGAGIDQHIAIKQHGGRAQISTNAPAATENPDLHCYLVSNFQEPSQPCSGGFLRKCAKRSRNSLYNPRSGASLIRLINCNSAISQSLARYSLSA